MLELAAEEEEEEVKDDSDAKKCFCFTHLWILEASMKKRCQVNILCKANLPARAFCLFEADQWIAHLNGPGVHHRLQRKIKEKVIQKEKVKEKLGPFELSICSSCKPLVGWCGFWFWHRFICDPKCWRKCKDSIADLSDAGLASERSTNCSPNICSPTSRPLRVVFFLLSSSKSLSTESSSE